MNSRQPSEDLFDSSRMSFGEHLEELRKVLVRAMFGLIPAIIIGFLFASDVIQILNQPLVDAINQYYDHRAEIRLIDKNGFVPPEYQSWMKEERLLPGQAYVDPGQLIVVLQSVIPNFGENLDLDPYGFRSQHFIQDQISILCQRLENPNANDPEVERLNYVFSRLTPSEQDSIRRIAAASETNAAAVATVKAIFNRLSKLSDLSDGESFNDQLTETDQGFMELLTGPAEPKPLAKLKEKIAKSPEPTLNRRLNRALITDLFPDQMSPVRVDLMPIEIWEKSDFEPQSLGVTETFMVWLKAGIFTGLVVAGPWIFYQLWSFVAAGLYPHEKKYIHVFLPISIALFVAGVLLAFFFVFQPVLGFLFSFNQAMGISPEMRINDWLSFVMFLPLGFGIAFQLPLVMLFMHRIGLFSVEDYLGKWRIAVMIIFVLAMFLTPADPISMLLLAVPLTILYFLGILLCRWMPRIQNPYAEDAALASQ
ncbi:MAG: twin-arginine translocase subunit TatC [Planctomycetota bacterium]